MCHLVLAMPLLALPLFWLMPPAFSIPVYILVAAASAFLYWKITRSMASPVATGAESLSGASAEIVSRSGRTGSEKYLVRAEGELWAATSGGSSSLEPGQTVSIAAVDGLRLVIEPVSADATGTKKAVKQGCH